MGQLVTALKRTTQLQCTYASGTRQAAAGEQRKIDAHTLLESRRASIILRARRALLEAVLRDGTATADEIRDRVQVPDGVNPICLGAVPGALAKAGIIEADGYRKSRRGVSHSRPVQVWRLKDRAAALAWLQAHPDRPDPVQEDDLPLFVKEVRR